jgi:hypothetical protein
VGVLEKNAYENKSKEEEEESSQLEFNTRNPLVAEKVVNFLSQFNVTKVREVR